MRLLYVECELGTQGEHLNRCRGRIATLTGELEDSSNRKRFGPLYRACCHTTHGTGSCGATVGGTSQLGGGPVRRRGRAYIRNATSFAPCANPVSCPTAGLSCSGAMAGHHEWLEAPQRRAHIGGQHSGRLWRGARLETVRAHPTGSPSCKPSAGSSSGRRMAHRFTTSATVPSRPRCTAWCSSTRPPATNHQERAALGRSSQSTGSKTKRSSGFAAVPPNALHAAAARPFSLRHW